MYPSFSATLSLFDQVVPGELTIVTGVPNSGKSEWIDALLCNLNERVGWKFALCSMENKVLLAHWIIQIFILSLPFVSFHCIVFASGGYCSWIIMKFCIIIQFYLVVCGIHGSCVKI